MNDTFFRTNGVILTINRIAYKLKEYLKEKGQSNNGLPCLHFELLYQLLIYYANFSSLIGVNQSTLPKIRTTLLSETF